MHKYKQEYNYNISAEKIFNIVKDVKKYPEFLPWCDAVRILESNENFFYANMLINFKNITEKYTSKVTYLAPENNTRLLAERAFVKGFEGDLKHRTGVYEDVGLCQESTGYITSEAINGPFKTLYNKWEFYPIDEANSKVLFEIEFEFKSKILNKLIGSLFETAVRTMTKAFEERAIQYKNNL
ncbi:MAG: type II toxin-antitoxin system RatA family toxin [Alphaproteobacteria bacterium]